MSIYQRIVKRLGILAVLVTALTIMAPKAKADPACLAACSDAWRACTDSCSWPGVDEGCQEACQNEYLACRDNCG